METKVIIKEQKLYQLPEIEKAIRQIFEELNLSKKLENKERILIKPNLLGAYHPNKAVTTHPIIIEAVIIVLKSMGKEVIVGDSPGGTIAISKVWKETGVADVCERHDVQLVDFGKDGIVKVKTDLTTYYFDKHVYECDAIINLAKMKTHSLMLYTGAVKNLYGAIPGLYKTELHKDFPNPKDFSLVLSTVYELIKPKIALNIVDGIVGMEGEGPSAGRPYHFGVLLAAEKASAVDYVASKMMGFDFNNIAYLKQSLNADNIQESEIEVEEKWQNFTYEGVNIQTVIFRNKILERMPGFIKNILQGLFSYYPAFSDKCTLCSICARSCPVNVISINNRKIYFQKKHCIKCLCCHEMCPVSAIYLKKSFLTKLVFRK